MALSPQPTPPPFRLKLAFAWTGLITAVLWLALLGVYLIFKQRAQDIALLGATQVLVYSGVLWLFAFAQGARVRDVIAPRLVPLRLCLAAAALGFVLQIPATMLSNIVEHFFPVPDAVLHQRMLRLTPHSTAHGVAIFAVVAVFGPCLEELFFRGALFGALRRGYTAGTTISAVSLCFALGHLELRLLLPLYVVALALGDVRERSGSVWPGFALHAAFNAATLAAVFSGNVPNGKPPPMPLPVALLGCVLCAALLALTRRIAQAHAKTA